MLDDPLPSNSSATRLEVKLDGPIVSAREFLEKASAMIGLVNSVAVVQRGGRVKPPQWIVRELHMGSAVLVVERDSEDRRWDEASVGAAIQSARDGLLSLARPDSPRPPYFGPRALKSARRLATPPSPRRAGNFWLYLGGERVEPSAHIKVRVDQITAARLKTLGSIEGKLIDLSARDGYSIAIVDQRTKREIRCVFPETMKARVRSLFDERVRARGVIWSRENGDRVELELRHIDPLLAPTEMVPTAAEVRGILRAHRHAAQ